MTINAAGRVGTPGIWNGLLVVDGHGAVTSASSGLGALNASWGGTSSVQTATGLGLPACTITSLSGFDYRLASPVPQPSMAVPLPAGGLALALYAMRKRHAAAPG